MRDGQATRRRLLDAATAEFAAHGIAGARVDRISANARANKAQLYAYYGDKDGLFDAVFHEHSAAITDAVPMTAEDLPGYAVRLYDACLDRPELVRLATWARLERIPPDEPVTARSEQAELKVRSIADAQRSGHVDPELEPAEVLAMVATMALTWSPASLFRAATKDDPDAVHARRRRFLADTVRRAFAPGQGT